MGEQRIRPAPWTTIALAGVAGGVTFLTLESVMLALSGREPWLIERMIAATLVGERMLERSTPALGAVLVGLALGLFAALATAWLLSGLIRGTTVPRAYVVGATSGLLLYFVVFHVFSLPFRWFASLQGVPTALAMAMSGAAAVATYVALSRRTRVPGGGGARA